MTTTNVLTDQGKVTLLETIFKSTILDGKKTAETVVKETLLEETEAYDSTLKILTNHGLDHAEVYAEVKINYHRLVELKKDIEDGVDNPYFNHAVETVQLNSLESLL